MTNNNESVHTVLVTGGSGFIGGHAIAQLLAAGHLVRATVRDLRRAPDVRAHLAVAGVNQGDRLVVMAANLADDAGWADAVAGCDYVLHVASPTPLDSCKHEDDLIVPAREGVLRVLRAARDASVKRVVLTSAFGAVGVGHPSRAAPFTEEDWSLLGDDVPAYQKSKTLAERAAWDFIAREGGALELAAINPVGVLGPVFGGDYSHSIQVIQRMLAGKMPGCPRISSGYVDVRDVADLHVRAMTSPAANGQRFLAVSGESLSMLDIAKVLRARLGAAAAKVPTREIPNFMIKLAGVRDPAAKALVPHLGKVMRASGEKARRLLGWSPRNNDDSIADTAESLIRLGLVDRDVLHPVS